MKTKICKHCSGLFEGRANKLYCSIACKSAVGNEKVAQKNTLYLAVHKVMIRNKRIVRQLYDLYGSRLLPMNLFTTAGFDASYNDCIIAPQKEDNFKSILQVGKYHLFFYDKDKVQIKTKQHEKF